MQAKLAFSMPQPVPLFTCGVHSTNPPGMQVQAFKVYFLARYGLRYQAGLEELARYRRDDLLAAIRLPGGEEKQV